MDWKTELLNIRKEAQASHLSETVANQSKSKAQDLLKQVEALKLLRDMLKLMLDGVGKIETFENQNDYDIILALIWDGPIREPKPPRAASKERSHIFLGVAGEKLYVNGVQVEPCTTAGLQTALLAAARKLLQPGE